MSKKVNGVIRGSIQIIFLIIFITLMFIGKAQLWMGFIFLSILLAAFYGRFYCGYACPINTLMKPFNRISKKLGFQKKEVPQAFKSGKVQIVVFTLFLVGLGYTIYTITQGRKFPLPLIIIPLGIITTLFINEKTWHRYLCPWGVLFSLTARFSKRGINVENTCVGCSACEKVCPGDAIKVDKSRKASIEATNCLLCMDCVAVCKVKAIDYKKINKDKK